MFGLYKWWLYPVWILAIVSIKISIWPCTQKDCWHFPNEIQDGKKFALALKLLVTLRNGGQKTWDMMSQAWFWGSGPESWVFTNSGVAGNSNSLDGNFLSSQRRGSRWAHVDLSHLGRNLSPFFLSELLLNWIMPSWQWRNLPYHISLLPEAKWFRHMSIFRDGEM